MRPRDNKDGSRSRPGAARNATPPRAAQPRRAAVGVSRAAGAGAAVAAILLTGSATFGGVRDLYRLTHSAAAIPFAEDSLQLLGEAVAAIINPYQCRNRVE